jgi:hypothetical protein
MRDIREGREEAKAIPLPCRGGVRGGVSIFSRYQNKRFVMRRFSNGNTLKALKKST